MKQIIFFEISIVIISNSQLWQHYLTVLSFSSQQNKLHSPVNDRKTQKKAQSKTTRPSSQQNLRKEKTSWKPLSMSDEHDGHSYSKILSNCKNLRKSVNILHSGHS